MKVISNVHPHHSISTVWKLFLMWRLKGDLPRSPYVLNKSKKLKSKYFIEQLI